jgi:ribokinase
MQQIVVIGSTNTDMVIKTERFPKAGETILGCDFFMFAGGKGANQAVAAARMGGDVTFISKLGTDIFGSQSLEGFKKENINSEFVFTTSEVASGTAIITINKEGENEIVVAPGANGKLTNVEIAIASKALEQADIILMQLEIPLDTVEYSIAQSIAFGKKVILNPAPAQQLNKKSLQGLFLITPNETEAALLSGIKLETTTDLEKMGNYFLSCGVQNVIITLGANGAFYMNNTETYMVPTEKVHAIDTTAAGDVFNGSLAVYLAEGKTFKEAITLANKCAAISVTRLGAQPSAPYRNELML